MRKQKPLPVIAGKKQCAKPSIAAAFVAAKGSFSRRLAWSHRRTFLYLRNFDRSWSSLRGFWRRLRAVWAISGSRHQPRSCRQSVSCDRVNVNKPKLQNFDRPLGLPSNLLWSFLMSTTCHLLEIGLCWCVASAAAVSRETTVTIA